VRAASRKLKNENGLDYKASQVTSIVARSIVFSMPSCDLPGGTKSSSPAVLAELSGMVKLADASPVIRRDQEENGFKITADQFRDAMTPATKLIILNRGQTHLAPFIPRGLQALAEVRWKKTSSCCRTRLRENQYDGTEFVSLASLSSRFTT